jgi:Putative DNA-binding domain
MALITVPLSNIFEGHLQRLIAAQATESLYIEYKRETYGANDDQRREFLADVSSFANAAGGDLLIGMSAAKGTPTGFHPFTEDADAERLRLEQMARDGLQPRIPNLQTRAIPLSQGGCVVLVRVPKSYNPPHRVIFKNSGRFWARSSAGKYEPNVEELRRIFTETPLLAERARSFRLERIARIAAHETPVPLQDGGILILHVAPFAAFDFGHSFSLDHVSANPDNFPPIAGTSRNYGITFDGFLTASTAGGLSSPQRAYVQVLRTGIVESVVSSISRGKDNNFLILPFIQSWIAKYAHIYASSLQSCGADPPFAVMVSLADVKGKRLVSDYLENTFPEDLPSSTLDRDQYHFVEAIFEHVPLDMQDAGKQLKATLDHLANAAGLPSAR